MKIIKIIKRYIITNICLCSLYIGFIFNIDGLINIGLLITWVFIVVSFLLMSDDIYDSIKDNFIKNDFINNDLNIKIIYNLLHVGIFIWNGYWFTLFVLIIGMIHMNLIIDKLKVYKTE